MKQYGIDAFTDKVFTGNPAAVCIMEQWLPDDTMQKIAIENNLSETAFAVKENQNYHLRWFTPGGEISLCGHATLAAAYAIMRFTEPQCTQIQFDTLSGTLTVQKQNGLLTMDFPSFSLKPIEITEAMIQALGIKPAKAYLGADIVCVLENEDQVKKAVPNLELIRGLDGLLLHITSRGTSYDCVTRSFAPKCGVAEDPVCGRGHCHVVPFWANELGRQELTAYQASARGGILYCRHADGRTILSGKAVLFSEAQIYFDE
ncbi:MAG: PhzF family phenazine biosynthesis protein [Lachnospiraceae bacterium]|nr:PhzF family phenazine biosynthesis protein [Lachnospiraceae bacterium]